MEDPAIHPFVVLLRAINVGGARPVPMATLRTLLAGLGLAGVETYLQSGNVVASTGEAIDHRLRSRIETAIRTQLGFDVSCLLIEASEMTSASADHAFLSESGVDPSHLHVTFLEGDPSPQTLESLAAIAAGPDRFASVGRQIHLHCPLGYGTTKLNNSVIERRTGLVATTRNMKTVRELDRRLAERDPARR